MTDRMPGKGTEPPFITGHAYLDPGYTFKGGDKAIACQHQKHDGRGGFRVCGFERECHVDQGKPDPDFATDLRAIAKRHGPQAEAFAERLLAHPVDRILGDGDSEGQMTELEHREGCRRDGAGWACVSGCTARREMIAEEPDPKPEGAPDGAPICERADCFWRGLAHHVWACTSVEGGTSGGGVEETAEGHALATAQGQGGPVPVPEPVARRSAAGADMDTRDGAGIKPGPPLVAPSGEAAALALAERRQQAWQIKERALHGYRPVDELMEWLREHDEALARAAYRQGEEAGSDFWNPKREEAMQAKVDAAESRARAAEIGKAENYRLRMAAEERARTARRDAIEEAVEIIQAAVDTLETSSVNAVRGACMACIDMLKRRALAEPTRSGE